MLLTFSSAVFGQSTGDPRQTLTDSPLTTDQIDAEMRRVEQDDSLEQTTRTTTLELLQQAKDQIGLEERHRKLADKFSAASRTVPKALQALKSAAQHIDDTEHGLDLKTLAKQTTEQLRSTWLQQRADLATQESKLRDADEQLAAQDSELDGARRRLSEVQKAIADLRPRQSSKAAQEQPSVVEAARNTLLRGRRQALSQENRKLAQQIATHPLRFELLQERRKQLERDVEARRGSVRQLEDILNERQLSEARTEELRTAAVQLQAEGKHPLLTQLAQSNTALGKVLSTVARQQERLADEIAAASEDAKRLKEDFERTRKQIEIAGLSQVLGQALRERRLSLPNMKRLRRRADDHEKLIAEANLRQIDFRQEQHELASVDGYVARLVSSDPTLENTPLTKDLKDLAKHRRDLLEKTVAAQENYIRSLSQLDFHEQEILETTEAYDDYLGERLLWIRSAPPLDLSQLLNAPGRFVELLSLGNWWGVVKALLAELLRMPLWLIPVLFAVTLLTKRRTLITKLVATSTVVNKPTKDQLTYTWQAAGLTLVLAAAWPVLLMTVGAALESGLGSDPFASAVGQSLVWLVRPIFFFETFRMLCHPNGLGATHFRWLKGSLHFLRRTLAHLMAILIPFASLTIVSVKLGYSGASVSLPFIVVELVLAWFLYRVMRPGGVVLRSFVKKNASSLLVRLRFVWFPLLVAIPIALAFVIARGYTFTAGELTQRYVDSLWFVLALVVMHAIAIRWLLMTRRRIAYQNAAERREAAKHELEIGDKRKGKTETLASDVEMPNIDITALDIGTRKLLSLGIVLAAVAGFGLIWSDILPALGILERVELWQQTITEGTVERLEPVTLADLALAIAIGLVATVLARNLPPFIEVVVLQRLGTSPGSRYAVSALLGYVIAAIGAVLAVNMIGANWSKLQWLVAALGVGIGFGLQEIVANFISGLIILFERPIRVGDVVTVGDTDGMVTRIQIRATTIRGWDQKELLVPNKEFIIGRLLNWSLSDQLNRVLINVGIAYGSDVELALRLLLEAAEQNDRVLDDPRPLALFEGFGDNALNISLRCYLTSLDYRLTVTSELNLAINRKFADAGIEIPFPQRDLHLSTQRPLAVRLAEGPP